MSFVPNKGFLFILLSYVDRVESLSIMYVKLDGGTEITHKIHLCLVLEGLDESIRGGVGITQESTCCVLSNFSKRPVHLPRTLPLLRTTNKNESKNYASDGVLQGSSKVSSSHLQLHILGFCMVFISTEELHYIWNKGEWKSPYGVRHALLAGLETRCVMVVFLLVLVAAIADRPLIQQSTRTVACNHTIAWQNDWATRLAKWTTLP